MLNTLEFEYFIRNKHWILKQMVETHHCRIVLKYCLRRTSLMLVLVQNSCLNFPDFLSLLLSTLLFSCWQCFSAAHLSAEAAFPACGAAPRALPASRLLPALLSWRLFCLALLQQLLSNPLLRKTFPNILPLQDFSSLDSYVCVRKFICST